MGYQLGILDQSPIFAGKSAEDALQSTIHLAQKAEQWGYERFWVAEHHQSQNLAGTSPEVLISHLLAKTTTIKLGSGGVMLQHYSPYKVTEDFQQLTLLSPGRVELGIGKAPGGFSYSTRALRYGVGSDIEFAERFAVLNQLILDTLPEHHPLYGAKALPRPKEELPVFLLGASPNSARLAAEQKTNFVYAYFLNSQKDHLQKTLQEYRVIYPAGKFMIAIAVFAAPTQEEAEQEAADYKIYKIHTESGRSISVQSVKQIEIYRDQTNESFKVEEQTVEMIAGSLESVKTKIDYLAATHQIDEFIIHTPIRNEAKRLQSFALLSKLTKKGKVRN
ncbi:MsnO8 family LLM class oxidoreductase [Ornithinibacillus gellani]|nr:MsnO8 family LLM class oxidoreductase [Ornithinibacillus gellani]